MAAAGDTARERVIGAAVELFSEHGVQGTSLRMIADRLGVAKGAVYYQFPCKDRKAAARWPSPAWWIWPSRSAGPPACSAVIPPSTR